VNYGRHNYTACRDCTKREVGCHAVCPTYQEFHESRLIVYERRTKKAERNRVFEDHIAAAMKRGRTNRHGFSKTNGFKRYEKD